MECNFNRVKSILIKNNKSENKIKQIFKSYSIISFLCFSIFFITSCGNETNELSGSTNSIYTEQEKADIISLAKKYDITIKLDGSTSTGTKLTFEEWENHFKGIRNAIKMTKFKQIKNGVYQSVKAKQNLRFKSKAENFSTGQFFNNGYIDVTVSVNFGDATTPPSLDANVSYQPGGWSLQDKYYEYSSFELMDSSISTDYSASFSGILSIKYSTSLYPEEVYISGTIYGGFLIVS